jgi:uncharacterized protein YndB with AHSA1/START domain
MAITFELEEVFAAAPQQVFEALTNLEGAAGWMPNVVRIEKLTEGAFGIGTRWREIRRLFGREAREEFEVKGFEPHRALELHVDGTRGTSKRGYYRFHYTLDRVDGGTRLKLTGEVGGMGSLGDLIGRLFAGSYRSAILKDLQAMRAHLEAQGSTRPLN